MHTHTYIHENTHAYHLSMSGYIDTYMETHAWLIQTDTLACLPTYIHTYIYIHTFMHLCLHIYMHIYMEIWMHMLNVWLHTYI